jgi:hypothetical protein
VSGKPQMSSEDARVIDTLNHIIAVERAAGRHLSALDLIVARDAVEVAADLQQAIAAHKFDTEHILAKAPASRPRMADTTLYERAGMTGGPS